MSLIEKYYDGPCENILADDYDYCDDCGGTCDGVHSIVEEITAAAALVQLSNTTDKTQDVLITAAEAAVSNSTVNTEDILATAVDEIETLNHEILLDVSNLSPELLVRKFKHFMNKQHSLRTTINDAILLVPHETLKTLYTNVFKVEYLRFLLIQLLINAIILKARVKPHVKVVLFAMTAYLCFRMFVFVVKTLV